MIARQNYSYLHEKDDREASAQLNALTKALKIARKVMEPTSSGLVRRAILLSDLEVRSERKKRNVGKRF